MTRRETARSARAHGCSTSSTIAFKKARATSAMRRYQRRLSQPRRSDHPVLGVRASNAASLDRRRSIRAISLLPTRGVPLDFTPGRGRGHPGGRRAGCARSAAGRSIPVVRLRRRLARGWLTTMMPSRARATMTILVGVELEPNRSSRCAVVVRPVVVGLAC